MHNLIVCVEGVERLAEDKLEVRERVKLKCVLGYMRWFREKIYWMWKSTENCVDFVEFRRGCREIAETSHRPVTSRVPRKDGVLTTSPFDWLDFHLRFWLSLISDGWSSFDIELCLNFDFWLWHVALSIHFRSANSWVLVHSFPTDLKCLPPRSTSLCSNSPLRCGHL